jgi:hypothetical protein
MEMTKPNSRRHKTLYGMFRDGIVTHAIENEGVILNEWHLIPEVHIGRMPTMTLIRKMTKKMIKDFPGAVTNRKGEIKLTPDFVEFAKTHRELNTSDEEVKQAWAAMRSMTE